MKLIHNVGIAIKRDAYEKLSDSSIEFLNSLSFGATYLNGTKGPVIVGKAFSKMLAEKPQGYLFIASGVAPCSEADAKVSALVKDLLAFSEEQEFLIIEAYSDYPDMESGDYGAWFDNPFKLRKKLSVVLEYNHYIEYGDDYE